MNGCVSIVHVLFQIGHGFFLVVAWLDLANSLIESIPGDISPCYVKSLCYLLCDPTKQKRHFPSHVD